MGDDYGNINNNEDSNAFSNPSDEYTNNSSNDYMNHHNDMIILTIIVEDET